MVGRHKDKAGDSFTRMTVALGCAADASADEQVAFMQSMDAGAIVGCFRHKNDSGDADKFLFGPAVDNKFIYTAEEQVERAKIGLYAKVVDPDMAFNRLCLCS